MKHYHVYAAKISFNRTEKAYNNLGILRLAFDEKVLANSRTEAIEKCLPKIGKLIDAISDKTIKFVSVYSGLVSGTTQKAERLMPVQIDVTTKQIRGRL